MEGPVEKNTLERDVGRLEGKVSALEMDMISVKSALDTLRTKIMAMDKRLTILSILLIILMLATGFKDEIKVLIPFV